jgi:cytosine/uracil/thiamine/allantoin permease
MRPLYDYAWFVGFLAAGGLYALLMRVRPLEPPPAR